jgi:hypothetical protein
MTCLDQPCRAPVACEAFGYCRIHNIKPASADASVKERSPLGVSEHDMTPGWRVIVARRIDQARTWYFHINDDKRLAAALRRQADEWANRPNA